MSMKDVASKMKAAKEKQQTAKEDSRKSFDFAESMRLRGKMLGVLMRDARTSAHRSIEDCARLLRVSTTQIEAWEYGDSVPSLPQLELLAYYLDVPVSHFWGLETYEASSSRKARVEAQQEYVELRQRMIGALVRQAREEGNLTLEQVSDSARIPVETLEVYELGQQAIPMPELNILASALDKNISYFLETGGQIGDLLATREAWKHFNDLPEDLREFAANPLNIGFIEIALAFSQMPNDKLKRVATSMLDITGY